MPPTRPLVLASASPARARLLRAAGLEPVIRVSGIDETGVTGEPRDVVVELARRKASHVAALVAPEFPTGLVVGCDSMLLLDGELLGKPASAEDAVLRWKAMRGRQALLVTGHAVIDLGDDTTVAASAETVVRFGLPSDSEVAAYAASGEPLGVAGAFTLDGLSAPFVDGIDGDPGNVIGLSLPLLRRLLRDLGVEITDLWQR